MMQTTFFGGILAAVDFRNPLLWALMIGWIMTVVLHEFAHGIVAYWGGDYTIRERGGLTLNPLQYVDPLMSIVLPVVFLMMGGIPLPGGATFIRRDLLKNNFWQSAVSAAGPAMNLLIFFGLCLALHPSVGWVNYDLAVAQATPTQVFVAGMAFTQLFSVILNLVPVPPLDGYGIISSLLPLNVRNTLAQPNLRFGLFIGYFLLLSTSAVGLRLFEFMFYILDRLGLDGYWIYKAFEECLRDKS